MKASLALIFTASLLALPSLSTAQQLPAGKLQQLSSPDQVPEGLAKSDWSSIRAAYEARRHAFQPIEGGWQARNPGQQWTTKFDKRGFLTEPKGGGWQWGLELKSYGFGNEQQSISGTPAVKAEGQRLSYQWDASVQEWFVNDKRGLEHGFTIKERPFQDATLNSPFSTLNFHLTTRGTLHPSVTDDALGVLFQDITGATVLNYTGLKVWDADGRILRSHFEAVGATDVFLRVEETDARYPLTIDPIAQQAYLKASNAGAGDQFGNSVAVSGDTVVVGAHTEASSTTGVNSTPNESATDSGAVYVFIRNGTTWSQQAYLKASNTGAYDYFGCSVAVSGDTVVVGAQWERSSTTGVNSSPNENFSAAGAAYVFTRSGTTWSQQAFLKASNTGAYDYFGYSVAVSGNTVVIGAYGEDSSTTGVNSTPNESASISGAAYVFTRSGTTWSQQAYLKGNNTGASDQFGYSVGVSGDTVVVGANGEASSTTGVNSTPNENASSSGAAYVFTRSGTTWSQQAYLKASNTGSSDQFGNSVAVSGDTLVVGAFGEDSSTSGVNNTPNENASSSGAAYVFTRSGTNWSQQAYLKASNTGANDWFGYSVAVSGDTAVIGAYFEDSSTSGVNSTPNENASSSGAAYVFTRSGTTWGQQAYLKASNTGTNDYFGNSVAVSGGTVVIGANLEDSSTSGVNSTPNENANNSGAVYLFTGLGPAPTLTSASPTTGNISGGTSVTLTGANFTGATAVTFGGTPATSFTVNSATSITVTTPAHAAGAVNVAVTTSVGTATGTNLFTYTSPDILITSSPTSPITDGFGSGAAIGFSRTDPSVTSERSLYLRNTGEAVLSGISASITGPDASQFSIPTQPGSEIYSGTPGTSFAIRFSPTSVGQKNAVLTIVSNDPDESPFTIALSGLCNTLPTYAGYSATTTTGAPITLSFTKLKTKASDADGEPLTISSPPTSAQGGTVTEQATGLLYTPPAGFVGTDTFQLFVQDTHPGIDGMGSGTVTITITSPTGGGTTLNPPVLTMNPGGTVGISFQGIPGRTYQVQRSTDMATWSPLATLVADSSGNLSYTDPSPPPGSAFYRLAKP